jgi:hypothetical protein
VIFFLGTWKHKKNCFCFMHVKGLKIDQSPLHNACGGGHFVEEKGIEGILEPAPRRAGPYTKTR